MSRPINATELLKLDPRLQTVVLQAYPIPEQVAYQAAKNDYSEIPIHQQVIPDANKCGEWIVENLLANERGHYGCYSSDTEVLTGEGWVYWPDVTEDTLLAAYNTETLQTTFEKPSAVQRWEYEGKMYHLTASNPPLDHLFSHVPVTKWVTVDLLVSPDHRILYTNPENPEKTLELSAEDFYKIKESTKAAIPIPGGSVTLSESGYSEKWVNYKGTIHCATVSTGAVIVRRNSSESFVCGNCLEHPQITLSVSGYVHSVMVQARTHRVGVSFDCLAAESLITTVDGKITISDLYDMYERGEKLPSIMNLNEDSRVFGYAEIKKVFKNNKKELCQITLEDGKQLKCSMDHRIFTDNGWKRLLNLHVGDKVICDNNIPTTIDSIGRLRYDTTYDIEVDGKYHNFVCDGIVVHNCQSQRYTGKRVLKVASGELPPEDVFYVRPPGFYTNRHGKKYDWTEDDYQDELNFILEGCKRYANKYEKGMCEEHIRDYLAQAIRQNFVVSFNLRSALHFMDLRAKLDAQLEIQAFSEQVGQRLEQWAPHVWSYYAEKRLHRGRLAP